MVSEYADTPTVYMIPCVRLRYFVQLCYSFRFLKQAGITPVLHTSNTRYGRLVKPYPTKTFTSPEMSSFLAHHRLPVTFYRIPITDYRIPAFPGLFFSLTPSPYSLKTLRYASSHRHRWHDCLTGEIKTAYVMHPPRNGECRNPGRI